jgi:hypothetical protein
VHRPGLRIVEHHRGIDLRLLLPTAVRAKATKDLATYRRRSQNPLCDASLALISRQRRKAGDEYRYLKRRSRFSIISAMPFVSGFQPSYPPVAMPPQLFKAYDWDYEHAETAPRHRALQMRQRARPWSSVTPASGDAFCRRSTVR